MDDQANSELQDLPNGPFAELPHLVLPAKSTEKWRDCGALRSERLQNLSWGLEASPAQGTQA